MRLGGLALAVLLWPAQTVSQTLGQTERQALEEEIRQLREKLRLQQGQLDALEKRLSAQEPAPNPPLPEAPSSPPMDLSGYYSFRYLNDTRPASPGSFQSHVASLFFGKQMGKWRFHSEAEFEYAPVFEGNGASVTSARGEVLLETAWLNYSHQDWLNARAGLLLVPTYWRVHHYPSTTLTVENPLIDKQIFPASIVGTMIHGSRYRGEAGVDYTFYVGNGRGADPGRQDSNDHKASGGTFLVHVPHRQLFDTLDLGLQWYRDKLAGGERERIYGFESRIEEGRAGFLAEFAHADIGPSAGSRRWFREGYYLQPSFRVTPRTHLLYRYDRLNYDSRLSHSRDLSRHTVGLNFRPVPTISLKLEFQRYLPEDRNRERYSGLAAGIAFFFQ